MTGPSEPRDAFDTLRRPHQPIEPDPEFAAELRAALRAAVLAAGGTQMTTTDSRTVGSAARMGSLTPYLPVPDARRAIEFYVAVFGATPLGEPFVMADGTIGHAEVAIGDSVLMLAEEFPEIGHVVAPSGGATLRVEVPDADAAVERAVELGAERIGPVEDRGHGRSGRIRDPFGQRWLVAMTEREPTPEPTYRHGEVGYFTFTVPDDEKAKAFYGSVLGWRFAPGNVPRAWRVEGSGLPESGLWGGQAYAGWKLMYAVDDLAAAADRVRASGGVVRELKDEPYGRTADCVDDQGVEFWLWEE
ncbi:putative glyoxalase superfamily protein PhnB [Prauserella shujinwangii]|uniref:Putative glyoxalase superfamily protein PhnB n=1 Tax=Prauserella shujinwangii TaxID=1453103 RepID=A0A2T0LVI0_9PSEU|nr:VOC family protein [Prauserella shujinwangii]PRX47835.1 putative glyoxalase superfamily protein PhnB [Prauserella shujinwangii]